MRFGTRFVADRANDSVALVRAGYLLRHWTSISAQRSVDSNYGYGVLMKRKLSNGGSMRSPQRVRTTAPDYCSAKQVRSADGECIWPAPTAENVHSAAAGKRTLVVPDKDADGLSSGTIIVRTLTALGLADELIEVHLTAKGCSIHDESERVAMKAVDPSYVVVLDQGSRPGPPVIDSKEAKSLLIDHHWSDEFPEGATVDTASPFTTF